MFKKTDATLTKYRGYDGIINVVAQNHKVFFGVFNSGQRETRKSQIAAKEEGGTYERKSRRI